MVNMILSILCLYLPLRSFLSNQWGLCVWSMTSLNLTKCWFFGDYLQRSIECTMRKIDWLNVIMCYALQFLHANFLRMQKSYQLDVCHDLTHQHNQERFEIESGLNSEPLRLSIRTKRFYQFREDLWLNLSMQPRQVYASNRDKTVNDHELIGATKELTRGSS